MKISIEKLLRSNERFDTLKGEKVRSMIETISQKELIEMEETGISMELIKDNIMKGDKNLLHRKEMIFSKGQEPVDFAFERAIGKNDSVYSNFIDYMQDAKKKVGRIVVSNGSKRLGFATGFMVSEKLMLTNWHVFETKDQAMYSTVEFNYEFGLDGKPRSSIEFNFDPDSFFYSFEDLDYCLVAVESFDRSGKYTLGDIGYIYLDPTLGKLGNEGEECLNIIHHPGGDYKQLSIRENKFKRISSTAVWYESDTAQGSSGSPVFNDQWQVVALHHMGVADRDDNGNYVDKKGAIIPVIDGKIDVSRIHWIANEGIRISVIRKHLQAQFPNSEIVKKMFLPAEINDSVPEKAPNEPVDGKRVEVISGSKEIVNIAVPTELIEQQRVVNVNISTNQLNGEAPSTNGEENGVDFAALFQESYKLEKSISYTDCKGYQSDFLGDDFRVAIPKPEPAIRNHVAKLLGSRAYILRYYKFSVIFNELRKMPFISAVNVEGAEEKRQDFTERKDKWIRDRRIDLDYQLTSEFYHKSGFDKGHMSRREDANWGDTPFEAKRNADLTCVYTNACPQVPALNRSNKKGLWGKLEKVVLEYGAKKEDGKQGRISVFNGPIFKDSDPIFRGMQIPMEFYKVILWVSDNNKLKITAFKLSQTDLVDQIDMEDIGIDENIKFKEYQCSLKQLQKLTKLDFSDLLPYDTYKKTTDNELLGELETTEIIQKLAK